MPDLAASAISPRAVLNRSEMDSTRSTAKFISARPPTSPTTEPVSARLHVLTTRSTNYAQRD
eukprot:2285390-Prymnesium_polylepis.2